MRSPASTARAAHSGSASSSTRLTVGSLVWLRFSTVWSFTNSETILTPRPPAARFRAWAPTSRMAAARSRFLGPACTGQRNGAIELCVARLVGVDELDQRRPASILGEPGHQGLAERWHRFLASAGQRSTHYPLNDGDIARCCCRLARDFPISETQRSLDDPLAGLSGWWGAAGPHCIDDAFVVAQPHQVLQALRVGCRPGPALRRPSRARRGADPRPPPTASERASTCGHCSAPAPRYWRRRSGILSAAAASRNACAASARNAASAAEMACLRSTVTSPSSHDSQPWISSGTPLSGSICSATRPSKAGNSATDRGVAAIDAASHRRSVFIRGTLAASARSFSNARSLQKHRAASWG